ncbi:MAG TPA: hypothetical protein VN622_10985 [Clostridia bacterium]|nr:hypothetical protein [Clostridia bacterium]
MARPRKPTAQLERSGAFKHDPQRARERENEPVPSGPLGDPPENLKELQVEIWNELSGQAAEGVLTVCDRMYLEITCGLMARHRAGELLKAAEYNLIISCLGKMGMTPADRSKINAPTKQKQETESEFQKLAAAARGKRTEVN